MKTIDATPAWVAIVPLLIAALQSENYEAQESAEHELFRMAQAADRWNEHARTMKEGEQ